jgi:hypothetical protein
VPSTYIGPPSPASHAPSPALLLFPLSPPLLLSPPPPRPALLVSSAPALPRPLCGGDLPAVPPTADKFYQFQGDQHRLCRNWDFAAGPASPSAPSPRPCRLAVARRVVAALTPARRARRPSALPALRGAAPARVGPRRARPSAGGGRNPARLRRKPQSRAARNCYHYCVVAVCCLLCLFQASCFWLLPSVVLCVVAWSALPCPSSLLFVRVPLSFSCCVCLVVSVCVLLSSSSVSVAGGGRARQALLLLPLLLLMTVILMSPVQ